MAIRLTPKEPRFFDLFAASARHLVDASGELTSLLGATGDERDVILKRMHEIESASGDSTHEIIRAVNGAFVTPFDRADMHGLAVALDSCVGLCHCGCGPI